MNYALDQILMGDTGYKLTSDKTVERSEPHIVWNIDVCESEFM